MTKTAPANAYPRGLHAVYRGRIVRPPRSFERTGKPPMATSRVAVKMAAPSAPRADHDALTEWVNVIAFTERTRHLLMQCTKGMLVAISGNVTKEFYENRAGEREISRTIIVEEHPVDRRQPPARRVAPGRHGPRDQDPADGSGTASAAASRRRTA